MPEMTAGLAAAEISGYEDSLTHILAELERIDLLLHSHVARSRRTAESDAQFMGLAITEQEVDALLARPAGSPRFAWQDTFDPPAFWTRFDRMRRDARAQAQRMIERGVRLRLAEVAAVFELEDAETDLLLLCLAPELDLRYERLFAYLQDDVTKKRPSVDLLLSLLAHSFADKVRLREAFSPRSRLMRHALLQVFDDPTQVNPPLLARYVRLDPRIVEFLLGSDLPDSRLLPFVEAGSRSVSLDDLVLNDTERLRLKRLADAPPRAGEIIYLHGAPGSGKRLVAEGLCAARSVPVLLVNGERLLQADPGAETLLPLITRDARLLRCAVYWDGFEQLLGDDKRAIRTQVLSELAMLHFGAFAGGETSWEPSGERLGFSFLRLGISRTTATEREDIWTRRLREMPVDSPDTDGLAGKFRFTAGQIHAAAATALDLARARDAREPLVSNADLHEGCRLQSSSRLSSVARKITPNYKWNDLVLPHDRMEQLHEICSFIRYRPLVFGQWGFDRKLSLGKGLNCLFAGPPGTGKTMAAEVIASDLALDLYKIDLSTVVSKYIGETEKNLSRVFSEAENSHAILFFDEADALFGKRSEVKDSHDRYANIEIGYLLQKTEEYEGVVILATNFRKNMDEAFVRRMQFTIEFPLPDEQDRRRIWGRVWPPELPLGADVNLDMLARRFALAGANIRNVAVAAAFAGAQNGGPVAMKHVLHATRREFQKMGKVVSGGEFGDHRLSEE